MGTIQIEIKINGDKIASLVRHLGFSVPMSAEQILLTIGALENEKRNWLNKLNVQPINLQ